ncbi:MAG: hypothetical protein OK439_02300 [Thaumarchaeota archaeon]|nr:hypothetical protein [Nitrososphaerota archaeon]
MGVYTLSKITLIVPRSELPEATSYIAELGDFHPISPETDVYDRKLSALASNAYKISSELTFIIDNMHLNLEPSAVQKAFAGIKYDRTQIEAWNWDDYVSKLETRSTPIIKSLGDLIRDRRSLEKKRDDLVALQRALGTLANYNIDLGLVESIHRFHVEFVIVGSKDLPELKKSLVESTLIDVPLSEKESAVLVIGTREQRDRISKTLRSFDSKSVSIPKDLPQSPLAATNEIVRRLDQIRMDIGKNKEDTQNGVKSTAESILGLQEAADLAYKILEELKKSGKLKRLSIVQGYVPTDRISQLESRINKRWPLVTQEIDPQQSYAEGLHEAETGATEIDQPPTKFDSKNRAVVAHEPVTLTSGPPVYGEFDPTPILAVSFPIFYGIMFGDVGHGLLLMIIGGVIYGRGVRSMKNWGLLLLLAGISATVVGFLVGEIFGFELPFDVPKMLGITWLESLKQAIGPSNPNGLAFNTATVLFFIKFTIYVGVIHIFIGLGIGVYNRIRTHDYWHMMASLLPTISGYSFFLLFGFAFKSAHFNLAAVTNGTNFQANIGLAGLVVSIVWLFVAGPVLAKVGKIHGSVLSEVGLATMEFLEWVVSKFVGNTVSYVRLAILLVVHAALLSATNLLFYSYGYASVPILVVMNLLIFAFEGLIVYVQSLRLHLYEFFSKFYVGTGTEFNSITPVKEHVIVKWLGKKADS